MVCLMATGLAWSKHHKFLAANFLPYGCFFHSLINKSQMKKPDYIEGVYNYCDRWCERCFLASRCRVFEEEGKLTEAERDATNKAFWEHLQTNFQKTIALLHKAARSSGINLDDLSEEEAEKANERRLLIRRKVTEAPLSQLARQYVVHGRKWLDEKERFDQLASDYIQHFELGLKTEQEIIADMAMAKDCVEVLQWYLHFIAVKFSRALSGRENGESWAEEHGFPKDSDGSAKIALIATQRSMDAWVKLYELLPGEQESILSLLALLQKIKQLGEKEFPGAAGFKRPGFDE